LKLFGVNIQHHAAHGTPAAAAILNEVHGQPPIPLTLHVGIL
jgi:hypothetical protein